MYLIVGLGNPGREFEESRHNTGFYLIEELAARCEVKLTTKENLALTAMGQIAGEVVIMAMPQTYMNLSGESVESLVSSYQVDVHSELIIVYDDINLDLGRIRIRKRGSAGGHNGMKDIIRALGTDDIIRIRIGVGNKPGGLDLKDFVLGGFEEKERENINESVKLAADAVEIVISEGAEAAMNKFNPYRKGEEEDAIEKKERRESFEEELMAAQTVAYEALSGGEDEDVSEGFTGGDNIKKDEDGE